jgi:hypothetical protein
VELSVGVEPEELRPASKLLLEQLLPLERSTLAGDFLLKRKTLLLGFKSKERKSPESPRPLAMEKTNSRAKEINLTRKMEESLAKEQLTAKKGRGKRNTIPIDRWEIPIE